MGFLDGKRSDDSSHGSCLNAKIGVDGGKLHYKCIKMVVVGYGYANKGANWSLMVAK